MCPTDGVVEGSLQSPAALRTAHSCASVQHEEVMDALRLIQAGLKDFESRLARIELLLPETKKVFKPNTASDNLGLLQNLRLSDYASGSFRAMNQDSRDGTALPPNSSAAHDLPIRRTRDIKDQMIEEAQERRQRMHEAVDQIEGSSGHIVCPFCNNAIKKSCFLDNHFEWCIDHKDVVRNDSDDHDNNVCLHEDAGDGLDCCIVRCDYQKDEWDEEEYDEWFSQQMAKGSP